MSPTKPELKTLKEIKARKEERKKWKQENLLKKLKKQKLREQQASDESATVTSSVTEPPKEIPTVSIAVPGTILENAQSPELRAYLAGQIARAAAIFEVDEIIVFDDYGNEANAKKLIIQEQAGERIVRQSCAQMGRILQYLECPQYLRKYFFPMHDDLKYAGLINSLDTPHHLRQDNDFQFREGVTLNKPVKSGRGSQVNVGLLQEVHVDKLIIPNMRCTVRMLPKEEGAKKLKGILVSQSTPRQETGVYWGYKVRLANTISEVFVKCPYENGYDVIIGTSDNGTSVDEFSISTYKHLLIVFGGIRGLEFAFENDETLDTDDPTLVFHHYLNTCPGQGTRTIRTEEAILLTLAALRPKIRNM